MFGQQGIQSIGVDRVGLGEPLRNAIVDGAGEVGAPTMLSTLCISIVFVPIFLLQGAAKYLFSPLSVSVCTSLAASLGPPADYALISLLALNGLRVSETTGANTQSLGQERGHRTLTIIRKGGKVVTIPLAPRTARAIDLAIGERSEGPLFLTPDGYRLDRHGAARIVRRVTRRAVSSASRSAKSSARRAARCWPCEPYLRSARPANDSFNSSRCGPQELRPSFRSASRRSRRPARSSSASPSARGA